MSFWQQIKNVAGSVINPATSDNQTNGTQKVIVADATNTAAIVTGPFSSVKGLRVYGGPTDPVSDVPVYIDYDHHQNHEGEAFQYAYYNATLNGTVNFQLTVPVYSPAIWSPHMNFEFICDSSADLWLFESPTVNVAGSAVTTIRCRNRNVNATPGLVVRTGSTFTADGTELSRYITIASAKTNISSDTSKSEWILKSNTTYLVRITTGSSSRVMLRMNWYEDLGV